MNPVPTCEHAGPAGPKRIAREKKTVAAMIRIFCRLRHGATDRLCSECDQLQAYAMSRLERCPFGQDKPTCANCQIHCYKPQLGERIREVMRFAGPRMLWRHPVLAIWHLLDGRAAALRARPQKPGR